MKAVKKNLSGLKNPIFAIPFIAFLAGIPITYTVFDNYFNGSFPNNNASEVSDMLNLIVGLPLIIVTSFLALLLAAVAYKLAKMQDRRDCTAHAQEAVKLYTTVSLSIKTLYLETKSMIKQYSNYLH